MATLPNLDTSEISFIQYWNAIEETNADSIDPEDALSQSGINGYELYDNGWEGTYTFYGREDFHVRMKRDGWIIAWLPRDANFNQDLSRDYPRQVDGPWDLLHDWRTDASGSSPRVDDIERTTLSIIIERLVDELGEPAITDGFDMADCGLYNYEYSDAEEVVLFYARNDDQGNTEYGFLYNDKEVVWAIICAAGRRQGNYIARTRWDPDGLAGGPTTVIDASGSGERSIGTYEITNHIQSEEFEYYIDQTAVDNSRAHSCTLILAKESTE